MQIDSDRGRNEADYGASGRDEVPELTADWENALTLVAKGEMEREEFMADIETMVYDLSAPTMKSATSRKRCLHRNRKRLENARTAAGKW